MSLSVAAGAGGFIVTPNGQIIPIGPPTPIFRREIILNTLRELARMMGPIDVESLDMDELVLLIDEKLNVDIEE